MMRVLALAVLALLILPSVAAADPISGLIAAIGTAFKTAFTLKALVGFGLRTVLSVGLSLLSQKRKQKNRPTGIQTKFTTDGGRDPQGTIVGLYATAGHLVYRGSYDINRRFYVEVIELGDIPGVALSRLSMDGEWVDFDAEVHETYGRPILSKRTADGYDRAWLRYYDGTQTAADAELVAAFGADPDRPWTTDHIGTGVPYAVLTYDYSQAAFQDGVPALRFELIGIPLYDPRKDSTVGGTGSHRWGDPATWERSRNPMVILYNGMRGIALPDGRTWGGTCEAEDLPVANWAAAMDACDHVPPFFGRAQFEAGFEFRFDEQPAQVFPELLNAANAQIAELGGVWTVQVGVDDAPVAHITDADVLVSERRHFDPFPTADQIYNAIVPSHTAPDALWNATTLEAQTNAAWEVEDGTQRLFELRLPAVFNGAQARQLADAAIADQRRLRRHQFHLPPEYFGLHPLQTLLWTSAYNSYSGKAFEVAEVAYDLRRLLVSLSTRERDPEDFDPVAALELPDPPRPLTATAIVDGGVPGFDAYPVTITDNDGRDRRVGIGLIWSGEIAATCSGLAWEIWQPGAVAPEFTGSTQEVGRGWLALPYGLPDTDYLARARAIAANRDTLWSGFEPVTTFGHKLGELDLADVINDKIATANARADAAFERHDAVLDEITNGALFDLMQRIGSTVGPAAIAPVGPVPPVPLFEGVAAISADLSLTMDRLDFEVPRIRQSRNDMLDVWDHLMGLQSQAYGLDQRLIDAGIYTDPDSGKVEIKSVAHLERTQSDVQILVDALASKVSLAATFTDLEYVVGQALLTPTQNPLVNGLVIRTSNLEVALDAEKARIDSLSSTLIVDGDTVSMVHVTERLDSIEGTLELVATQTALDDAVTRLNAAEVTLSGMDAPEIALTVSATRQLLRDDLDDLDQAFASFLQGRNEGEALRQVEAGGRRALRAYVDAQFEAQADETLELKATTATTDAALREERLVRASETEAQAKRSDQLQADLETLDGDHQGTAAALDEVTVRVTETENGIQSQTKRSELLVSTVRHSEADALDLDFAAWLERRDTNERTRAGLAIALRQAATMVEEGRLAEAVERAVLAAELNTARASIRSETLARATADTAQVQRSDAIEAVINHATTGLAATLARIADEEIARADADTAQAQRSTDIEAVINHATTGLAATLARIADEEIARADGDTAQAQRSTDIEAVINHATTGLAATLARIADEEIARADGDTAQAQRSTDIEAVINHATTGLAATLARIADEEIARADADTAQAQRSTNIEAVINHATTGLAATLARIADEEIARADADTAQAQRSTDIETVINNPNNGLANAHARISTVESTKVDGAGAIAAITTEISGSYNSLSAMAQDTAFVRATQDGISAGYVWRLNGQSVLELVSVQDGTGGPTVTARIDADYVQITGLAQIDSAVLQDVAADTAFLGNLYVTNANIGEASIDTLKIGGNAVSFDLDVNHNQVLLPLAGWRSYTGIAVPAAHVARVTFNVSVAMVLADPMLDSHWSFELRRRSDAGVVASVGGTQFQELVTFHALLASQPAGTETYDLFVSFGNGVQVNSASIIAGVSYR
ncbi:hypothetical protein K3727_09430 [Rhodobacteraceae bacterium M382]|nr:hypothetical protein K3727_09430 [Rhodobacteraceae bacterium M382]